VAFTESVTRNAGSPTHSNPGAAKDKHPREVNRRKRGNAMPPNEFVATIVVLASAILLISFWKQILFILLFGVVMVFCFGLYNVAAAMGH
jgi:hypothetical protein